jgi:hypothetical protein
VSKIISLIIVVMLIFTTMACAENPDPESPKEIDNDTGVTENNNEAVDTTIAEETTTVEETTVPEVIVTEAAAAKIAPVVDEKLEKTEKPVITGTVNMSPSTICVTGKSEKDATIIVRGGTGDVSFKSSDIYFMGTTEVANTGKTVKLEVSAIVDGKAESDPVTVNAMYLAQVKRIRDDSFEVVLGSNSQGHFVSALPDYDGTSIMKDGQVDSLKGRIETRVQWLKDNTNGTELIYVVVPNSMTVFPETVPAQYKRFEGEGRSAQFIKAAKDAGATVLNVTDAMLAHKTDEFKLFHKTDSHWTEYGAWVAYTELMNYISKKWPDAAPRKIEEMGFYEKDVDGGDMPYYLGLDIKKVREVTVFSNPSFELPITLPKYVSDHGLNMNHDTTPKYKDVKSNRTNLPSAYVMRDSYGIAMYDMLAERFNRTVYESMWSYGFDTDKIKGLNVDYVIIIIAERNLNDVLY